MDTLTIKSKPDIRKAAVICAPELYADPEFVSWLNTTNQIIATWHWKAEPPNEFSDVFTHVCLPNDGSDSDMPAHCFKAIVDKLYEAGFNDNDEVLVWLQNIEVDTPTCDPPCKGECGRQKCVDEYQDFLSSER